MKKGEKKKLNEKRSCRGHRDPPRDQLINQGRGIMRKNGFVRGYWRDEVMRGVMWGWRSEEEGGRVGEW